MLKKLLHPAFLICISVTVTAICGLTWLMLTALPNLSPLGTNIPGFTELVVSLRHGVMIPALIVLCLSFWMLLKRKSNTESTLLLSCCAMTTTCIVVLPAVLAIYLHFLQLFEDQNSLVVQQAATPLIHDYNPTGQLN